MIFIDPHGPRADMTDGCPERFDWEFLCYIWSFNQTIRPQLEEALQNFSGTIIRIRRSRDIRNTMSRYGVDSQQ